MTARQGSLPVRVEQDVVLARQAVRQASELARNTVIYGGGGQMDWQLLEEGLRRGVRLVFSDQGPGIANIEQALTDGWSSGKGMGLGLSGSRRLVDVFELDTAPGRGTRITITKWT